MPFTFLALPAEIRYAIYALILVRPWPLVLNPHSPTSPSLPQESRFATMPGLSRYLNVI